MKEMKATHTFKLTSGVECEVYEMTGKHQELLTRQDGKKHTEKLNELLKDLIVRVGSNTDINDEFLLGMLACDKKKALVEVRQFSMGHEPSFTFNYRYTDTDGNKQEHPVTVDLNEDGHFPEKPVMVMRPVMEDGKDEPVNKLVPADWTEYSDVQKQVTIKLPRSGQEVTFVMLDGKGELIGSTTKKAQRSSHTLIQMRRPVFQKKTEGGSVPIQLNLNDLALQDIEYLRKSIRDHEGEVDTEIMFDHPEADSMPRNEKEVTMDVLNTVAFFFPSEAI